MKISYIISAYKNPDQLLRLIKALGNAPISIHIDSKSDIFEKVSSVLTVVDNVEMLPRHKCHWGLFGHVAASLEGLRWSVRIGADYTILLTGACFPIKSQAAIENELEQLAGRSMMAYAAFPKMEWSGPDNGGFARLDRHYFHIPGRKKPLGIRLWNRKLRQGFHPYGGSSYWCLSRACVDYVLKTVDSEPWLIDFFRWTYVPDEMFFQTILLNSSLASSIQNSSIHYTDWSGRGTGPAVIGLHDLPAVQESNAWFVRKVEDLKVMEVLAAATPD